MAAPAVIYVSEQSPEESAHFNAERAFLANITETEHARPRTYGMYIIPGKQPGEQFSLTEIGPRRGVRDFGDGKVVDFPIHARQIALDLEREINADAGEYSFLGVFVCGANGPTGDELRAAHARLEKFYQSCVQAGDREWQRSQQVVMIPDHFKRATQYLKQDRDWASAVKPQIECPGCGERLRPGIAVCKSCGAVLDRGKAIALGILRPDPEPASEPSPEPASQSSTPKGHKKS